MTRVRVKPIDAFENGGHEQVTIDGVPVGVLQVDGEFYAIENRCRHSGGPVCEGRVRHRLEAETSEPGERPEETFTGDPTVACPWHGWTYDLETGEHIGDPSYVLRTYSVVVKDGVVYVES